MLLESKKDGYNAEKTTLGGTAGEVDYRVAPQTRGGEQKKGAD